MSLHHILSTCSALTTIRDKLLQFTLQYSLTVPAITKLILDLCTPSSPDLKIIDCSVIPSVILASQTYGKDVLHHLYNITRTSVQPSQRERLKIIGRWNPT
eukprot:GFUD01011245.1.p1 GENE.GFUD01011245.1~~GFUD01011245.1.p1  ORF type:complete len:101 (+),score=8.27 GFUD01011245.1:299-601(+)